MYWPDKVAKIIIDSGKFNPYLVDDMKTLSGYPTIGSLRGPFVHDFIYKALKKQGVDATYTYVFNDFDPMDEVSPELKEKFLEYLGKPLKTVPSPIEGFENYADYFAEDFKGILKELGVYAKFLSSWEMYHQGKFDEVIKEALDNAEKIQDIYKEVSGSKKREQGWLPFQVICEACGKLGTTRVYKWDGEVVSYKCEPEMVKWAKGCGFEGNISPFGGTGKLPWKVDWPAHWRVIGVTIEGAGKDHASKGGSRDIAAQICKEIFHFPEPFNLPYEFFLIGGKKMSTSKGLGLKARDIKELLPPQVTRFLFCRTDYKKAIEFAPIGTMAIPDLFDEYDRAYRAYLEKSDEDLVRMFEMSQVEEKEMEGVEFLPRFIDVVNYIQQSSIDIRKKFSSIKNSPLNPREEKILEERIVYAKVWLEKYAPEDKNLQMSPTIPEQTKSLTSEQKEFLKKSIELLKKTNSPEELQINLYNLSKELNIEAKTAFSAIYISLIGKEFGPKAAWFLLSYSKEEVIKRFEEVIK